MFRIHPAIKPVAITLLAALMITACSGSNSPKTEGNPPTNGTSEPEPVYSYTLAGSIFAPVEDDAEILQYWENQFNVELIPVNIDQSEYDEVLNLKFASGEIPDAFRPRTRSNFQKYASQNLLAEIPLEMLQEHAPNLYRLWEEASPGAFQHATVNGKIYGIPLISYHSNYRRGTVFRGDWMKNVGVESAPETLEQFEQLMYKFSLEDPDQNGQKDTYGLSDGGMNAVYGAYGYIPEQWKVKDGRLVYGAIQPEMKEALAKLRQWFQDGVIDPEFVTGEKQSGEPSASTAFVRGRIGFTSNGDYLGWKPLLYDGDSSSQSYLEIKKVSPEAADALVYGVPPVGPGGQRGVIQGNMVTGQFAAFGKQLEAEPDKLAKLLQMYDYMNSTYENYLISLFGIQGKHWDYDAGGVPTQINGLKINDLSSMGAHDVFNQVEPPQYLKERSGPRTVWADENHWNEGGIRNALETTLPSSAQYATELDKIRQEAYISIITGSKPLDYFDEFVEKWNKSGGEQLEKEANEWYAEFTKK